MFMTARVLFAPSVANDTDGEFSVGAEIPFGSKPSCTSRIHRSLSKFRGVSVKSVVVNPKLLIEALRQFSQSDGMME